MVRRGQGIFCGCGRFRFGGASEGYDRRMLKDAFAAIRGVQQIEMFFDDVRDVITATGGSVG